MAIIPITAVKVSPRESGDGKFLGYASVTFAGCLVVRNIRIIEHKGELFISMPNRQIKSTGQFADLAFPLNQGFRDYITDAVLDEWEKMECSE